MASDTKQAHGWRRQIRSSVVCLSASLPVVVWIGAAWDAPRTMFAESRRRGGLADESGDGQNGQGDVVAADCEERDRAHGGLAIEAAVDDDAADHGRRSGRTHGHRGKRPTQKLRFEHKNPNTPDRSTVLKKNG